MEFEWDLSKEKENVRKHRISFEDAVDSFFDPEGFVLEDQKHSLQERRLYWIGKTQLTTRFTRRVDRIRIIGSAEWREFRRIYYEKTKGHQS